MAAFDAAAGQHLSAISSLHAFTKAVYRFSAAAMRLKCTFHLLNSFYQSKASESFLMITRGEPDMFKKIHLQVTTPVAL